MEPSGSPQREYSPKERPASSGNSAPKHQRSIERPLALILIAQPLALLVPTISLAHHLECFSCDLLIVLLMCTLSLPKKRSSSMTLLAWCASVDLFFRPLVFEAIGGSWSCCLGFLSGFFMSPTAALPSLAPRPVLPLPVASRQPFTGKTRGQSSSAPPAARPQSDPASVSKSPPGISPGSLLSLALLLTLFRLFPVQVAQ